MKLARSIALLMMAFAWLAGCVGHQTEVAIPTRTPRPTRIPVSTASVKILPQDSRPNIVLILADDSDVRLGTLDYMPHLQRLMIDQGLVIGDFFVSDPTCCPSRATILRGQYTHSHQIYTSAPADGFQQFYALDHDSSTLATWLQAARYRTILLGKYLNGYPLPDHRAYIPQGWDEWYSPARGKPYTGFNYTLNQNGVLVAYGSSPEDYLGDVLNRYAQAYLRAAAQSQEPFFMFLCPYQPHQPAEPAPRHTGLFEDLQAPRTASFDEADVLDKPPSIRFDPRLTSEELADLDDLFVLRIQSMQVVDEMIGQLFETLEATGELDDTYIIFTSDNGFHLGQHRLRAGKSTAYEEDINVPFIIRGPGIPAGTYVEGYLSGNVDIAPTLAGLAGIVPPSIVEGRSLLPLFEDQLPAPEEWRQAYLLEYYRGTESEAAVSSLVGFEDQSGILEPGELEDNFAATPALTYRGLRTHEFLYVEYGDGFKELYDLRQDPFEMENIIDGADRTLLAQLSAWLQELSGCSGSACLVAETKQLQ